MKKTYVVLCTEEHTSTFYITADTPEEARQRAYDLIANRTPSIIPDMYSPADIKIDDITEDPDPSEEARKNVEENDGELAELAD